MAQADLFVLLDDVQYTKNDWRNRNRILGPNGPLWLTVPVQTKGRFGQLVREVRIDNRQPWVRKHLRSLELAYGAAPYFEMFRAAVAPVYGRSWELLADLDRALIEVLRSMLGISCEIILSSDLDVRSRDPNDRLRDIMLAIGADGLYEGESGRGYMDTSVLGDSGVEVAFQHFLDPYYPQSSSRDRFVARLSVVDLLCNVGPDSLDVLTGAKVIRPAEGIALEPAHFDRRRRGPFGEGWLHPAVWDTEFFGFPIARVVLDGAPTDRLRGALEQAKREGVKCVFAEVNNDARTEEVASSLGYRLTDTAVWVRGRPVAGDRSDPDLSVRPATSADLESLDADIAQLAPWSRFAHDDRFGVEAAHAVYAAWVRNSQEDPDQACFVAEHGGRMVGFASCEFSPRRRLNLISSTLPGAGVGFALLRAASWWRADERPDLWIKASSDNTRALDLYQRNGFEVKRRTCTYHLWLDEV